jgi:uncharacterized protein
MITDFSLIAARSGQLVVNQLELADGYWSKLAGLQFRAALPPGHGLLLVRCSSVHTMFMRFAIDLVQLDDRGTVLAVQSSIRPWRLASAPRGTHAVLELPANTAAVRAGDRLALQIRDARLSVPRSLQFLPLA